MRSGRCSRPRFGRRLHPARHLRPATASESGIGHAREDLSAPPAHVSISDRPCRRAACRAPCRSRRCAEIRQRQARSSRRNPRATPATHRWFSAADRAARSRCVGVFPQRRDRRQTREIGAQDRAGEIARLDPRRFRQRSFGPMPLTAISFSNITSSLGRKTIERELIFADVREILRAIGAPDRRRRKHERSSTS